MNAITLGDLQESVRDRRAFTTLEDYFRIGEAYLGLVARIQPTRIVSPSHANYIFYQYGPEHQHRITRPLNSNLFIESANSFEPAFERFVSLLDDIRVNQERVAQRDSAKTYLQSKEINQVIYTAQQAIGCIGDSFENPNQSRKRIGQLFENFIKLIIQHVGVVCEPRTISLPIPGFPDYRMPYQLDLVFSRDRIILTSETIFIQTNEVVGSVKTTSKDRIDKVFLDKYLLTKLLGREIPVIAIFLHDVQRAVRGGSIFGINSTFKSSHFLGYTVALNRLDGVYYVDPRPEMLVTEQLREQIFDFQQFLTTDLWILSK
jgi:hypothetical protein